jgi:multidrug efflux pump subunit AcrA (membrane-fusion protein)
VRPPLTGRLKAVLVSTGQRVRAGEPVASIEPADAELDHYRKQAAVARAQRALERVAEGGDASLERLELKIARLEASKAEQVFRDTVMKAPFDGLVVQAIGQPGDLLAPGAQPAVVLVDPRTAFLELEGDQYDLSAVQVGAPCVAEFQAALAPARVKCEIVEGPSARRPRMASGAGATLGTKAKLHWDGPPLPPALAARVEVEISRSANVLIAPITAIVRRNGRDFVALRQAGVTRIAEVRRGLADESSVELLDGIAEGNEIFAGDTKLLNELFTKLGR